MTATGQKPRVILERWVRRGGTAKLRSIKCEFTAHESMWWVSVFMPKESDVYISVHDKDFHVAMEKAVKVLRGLEARRRKHGSPIAANRRPKKRTKKRTSRRARRTSRRAA